MKGIKLLVVLSSIILGYILGLVTSPSIFTLRFDYPKISVDTLISIDSLTLDLLFISYDIDGLKSSVTLPPTQVIDKLIDEIDSISDDIPDATEILLLLERAKQNFSVSREKFLFLEENSDLTEAERAQHLEDISEFIERGISFIDRISEL